MKKYIFVIGGVCSGLGKGIVAASIASLLEAHKLSISMLKIDPYLNVDAGTMSPSQHGEVYVTDDGAETDLDLGNYARFIPSMTISSANIITTGRVYADVIKRERTGAYLGQTVQVIPHITDRVQEYITDVDRDNPTDITVIEIGGTVGDIESVPYLEAARQMIYRLGHENVLCIHLALVPEVHQEIKTKLMQHSVKQLCSIGIQPDILLARCKESLCDKLRQKIALFTNVSVDAVFSAYDVENIYEIPLTFYDQGIDAIIMQKLEIATKMYEPIDLSHWAHIVQVLQKKDKPVVHIAVVGKYEGTDTYKSVSESLLHAGIALEFTVHVDVLTEEVITSCNNRDDIFVQYDGILVPGGFGSRGIEWMLCAIEYAREHDIPFFGICLGMQVMVIEYARNVLGFADANSVEFDENSTHEIISLIENQTDINCMGGSMHLGAQPVKLETSSLLYDIYGSQHIQERHRHRYEVNKSYINALQDAGLLPIGLNTELHAIAAMQWANKTFGIGVQYHPEFKSSPMHAHPLFCSFIKAAYVYAKQKKQ